uniref:Peptide chain release factor 1 putative n=1 Tax=Albugo laibachii Nc14 TaxID=890382 RepID=F0WI28_9STRA|nr:peptide chain release factor 1 putative [Albugo laibachii Nc14]|eukprot:CCA20906.1 peptide chain release factor 1 putative [Albugo laibachii Nc14]
MPHGNPLRFLFHSQRNASHLPIYRIRTRHILLPATIHTNMNLLLERHKSLSEQLYSPQGKMSSFVLKNLSIELAELTPKVTTIQKLQSTLQTIDELSEILASPSSQNDKELIQLAKEELQEAKEDAIALEKSLTRQLLPRDPADDKNCILEIRAGTGGEEACLFANDLLKLYQKIAIMRNWHFQILSISHTDLGGCKECVCTIQGRGVYGQTKFESGVHRVQRVPINDVRVHTSAVSVVVLPEIEEIEMELNPKELRIDVYRASGSGGQHVNTTESAVRITHIPTGIQAAVQDERSQHQNKAKAMSILRARVYDQMRDQRDSKRHQLRSLQIGSGDRSERIRTYNFPQSRVSDHRVNVTLYGIERFLNGELMDPLVDALVLDEQNNMLEELQDASKT